MGKVKVKKLREALEYVTAHPEEWDQGVWAKRTPCGTACCLAGRVVLQAGHELDYYQEQEYNPRTNRYEKIDHWVADYIKADKKYPNGEAIDRVAQDVLNYEIDDYWDTPREHLADLFEAGNSLRRLWELASELTDGKIEVPSYLPGDNDGAE